MPFYEDGIAITKHSEMIYVIYNGTFVITPGNFLQLPDCYTEVFRDLPVPKAMPSVAPAGSVNLHAVHSKIFDFMIRWEHPSANPSNLCIQIFEKELSTTVSQETLYLALKHQGVHMFSHRMTGNIARIKILNNDMTPLNNVSGELKVTWRYIG